VFSCAATSFEARFLVDNGQDTHVFAGTMPSKPDIVTEYEYLAQI
jgi:hypothetical protein